ncbi:MAG TPA: hypothetical protein VHK88_07085, partial [Aquihabitans sp.]|nr:hypothetical protein [Aquihabitans sp.]
MTSPAPHTDASTATPDADLAHVPAEERAFFVEEFAGATIVVALAEPDPVTVASVGRAATALRGGGSRLVAVVGTAPGAVGVDRAGLARALPSAPVVLAGPDERA